jgi:hypothetical protein
VKLALANKTITGQTRATQNKVATNESWFREFVIMVSFQIIHQTKIIHLYNITPSFISTRFYLDVQRKNIFNYQIPFLSYWLDFQRVLTNKQFSYLLASLGLPCVQLNRRPKRTAGNNIMMLSNDCDRETLLYQNCSQKLLYVVFVIVKSFKLRNQYHHNHRVIIINSL